MQPFLTRVSAGTKWFPFMLIAPSLFVIALVVIYPVLILDLRQLYPIPSFTPGADICLYRRKNVGQLH